MKALAISAEKMVVLDIQQEFVEQIFFRAIQCHMIYEDRYLLGTSLARPIIAQAQVLRTTATRHHMDTGKGSDQVRFELACKAIATSVNVILSAKSMSSFPSSRAVTI
ncbi:argininosuccinate synthase [Ilyonectria destructans]|nr:argininosuccinate synthase [Ilyonectria destructans]